ncbi:UNVERIFIED_CONTAM: hypothetical protein PYX00_010619 [Menopon gallinae]|uniref:Kinesin-like protein KIF13A n=1 Tax=Menopon gallinae TaxID=328185 RepID=A0AAW2HGU0_9NEOP
MTSDKIKVAVRVRPFNRRELELGAQTVIEMDGHQTILHHPSHDKIERKQPKTFAFDHCFYSCDPGGENFASQEVVFDSLGRDILDNAFKGYNACIFAYGQTGSGKSYTMMGSLEHKGIIPRLCDSLFDTISKQESSELSYKVEVSYMEIYNERVHDLLDPKPNKQSLKVREHNVLGPYVDGLSQLAVTSFQDIDNLMTEGNKSRTVAATNMNSESSRSHAVFSVILTQTLTDTQSGVTGEKVSRMSLVDLAGSERAVKTGAVGDRLKEGSNINKSLTTLGIVISKLADQSNPANKNKDKFVPYRDSVLTWLLKDNLGGNSKTVMVATISPSVDNYEETLSTLRYADRAKRIVNHAVVNEDPNARIIRELRQEVEALKEMLKQACSVTSPLGVGAQSRREDLTEKLSESEKLVKEMSQTWEEKLLKTERLQQERQQALEKMGISVQDSGIMVEKNKYYLVNLNADPSLNELLVYYLKEKTLVGSRNCDIQLSGLGIQQEHCLIEIKDGSVIMTPFTNARSFVNGASVVASTVLHHGDRILWGNHHFFRVNCPKSNSEPQTPAQNLDYDFAREELMMNDLSNDPIQMAIARLERQHEEDKQVALEKQRQEYERQFQQLRNILSPSTPYAPYAPFDPFRPGRITPCTPGTAQMRVDKWAQERDEMFRRSLGQLKQDIVKANALVQEANFLAEETGRMTKFSVTLQIPPANLGPNRKRGAFVSEPAILVKRKGVMGSQVWSMEKLENKLIDMRELYEEAERNEFDNQAPGKTLDPFYETEENHNLIGVANVFLEALFHDVKLDYHTPIISQQGEVAGRLQVELSRVAGKFPQDRICEAASECSGDSNESVDEDQNGTSTVVCRVTIKQASGLPLSLSNFVFCHYHFWSDSEPIAVPPVVIPEPATAHPASLTFKFDHTRDFVVSVTEEFIEHCTEGALSIEVWGHRSAGFSRLKPGWEVEQQQLAKARSLADRWSELTRKIELIVEIQELTEQGEYSPVEVISKPDVLTGGVYQLRQGQQRRIQVRVRPVQQSGTLPIICQSVVSIAIGSVCIRSRLQKALDSYQEEDLTILREKWSDALMRRRQYLDQQIQKLINKQDKTEQDVEREQSLVDQWVTLTEERNAVLVPGAESGIPGAPADWDPPPGMEPHVPVLFLDLNADDLSLSKSNEEEVSVAGQNSILPKEHGNKFYNLPIIKHLEKDVSAVAAWDSSIHDSVHLNKVTDPNERVYLILKTTVRLSHPAPMDLVLRKRLSLNIYKRQSITDRLFKKIVRSDVLSHTAVTYQVVSNIPKASEELENRESLAQIAASGEDSSLSDGETYIEKYTRGVSAVESILTLDRLRQSVAVKELLQAQGQPLMRKTASVPNFTQMLSRFDSSSLSDFQVCRSESVSELCNSTSSEDTTNNKQYGIASPNPKMGLRMTTLHEEHGHPMTPVEDGDEDLSDKENTEADMSDGNKTLTPKTTDHSPRMFETPVTSLSDTKKEKTEFKPKEENLKDRKLMMSSSRTLDSLSDIQFQGPKMGTPSTSSSGYGSAAVSTSNLLSEDSLSVRSISVDDSPEMEVKSYLAEEVAKHQNDLINKIKVDEPLSINHLNVNVNNEQQSVRVSKDNSNNQLQNIDSNNRITDQINDGNIMNSSCSSSDRNNDNQDGKDYLDVDDKGDGAASSKSVSGDECSTDSSSVMHTKLPPGKVVKRKKTQSKSSHSGHRASFPMIAPNLPESKSVGKMLNGSESDERLDDVESYVPDWIVVGESVLIRPYNTSGVVAFLGPTEFASGIWVGVELDAPTGKNDGVVQGVRYFSCKPKHGIFVRADKLILDKRGRAMRQYKNQEPPVEHTMRRSISRGEGLSTLHRSRSRGEGISSVGRSSPRTK